MTSESFEAQLSRIRPRLHRYCARMIGSTVDAEDMVQDTIVRALRAGDDGALIDNLEGWLLRIAHNICLDLLRRRSRINVVPLTEGSDVQSMPEVDIIAISFTSFLRLPELQRCAVILKDVLGHTIDEIASIADCTPAAAKSALQRGRVALRKLVQESAETKLPLLADDARKKMTTFTEFFRNGDFDSIRALLAEDVKLDLVNRLHLQGRERTSLYFHRYAEETKWRFFFGAVEDREAMLVFDGDASERPSHFVLLDWRGDKIATIRDFLFASYALESAHWVKL